MPSNFLSDERVIDSSDEDSSGSAPTQTLKQRASDMNSKGVKVVKPLESDNESETSSTSSETSIESPKSSVSSSGSASKRKASSVPNNDLQRSSKRSRTSLTSVKRVDATNYVPPNGYVLANATAAEFSSRTEGIFSDLDQKQVWHISAPSNMPASVLEKLDLSVRLTSGITLEHGDTRYLVSNTDGNTPTLMIPKGLKGEYASAEIALSQSMRIRESFEPPIRHVGSNKTESDEVFVPKSANYYAVQSGQTKPPRKQPNNLKVRYVPFGVQQDGTREANISITNDEDSTVNGNELQTQEQSNFGVQQTSKISKKSKHYSPSKAAIANGTHLTSPNATPRSKGHENPPMTESAKKRKKEKKAIGP